MPDPGRSPGGSSIAVPPFATPAACHASACSGVMEKPIVHPLPALAGWPSIGLVTRNALLLWKYISRPLGSMLPSRPPIALNTAS